MNLLFLGTPQFAVPSLVALEKEHRIVLALTQPDRPRGRGRRPAPPPVKVRAGELKIPIWQPERLDTAELISRLGGEKVDIAVVVAYGLKLPDSLLEIPLHNAVNLHFSLLPAYRGAAPVNWALIRGEKKTGVTVFRLTSIMDGGPVYRKKSLAVDPGDTAGELGLRMAELGADLLAETVRDIGGGLQPVAQPEEGMSRAPKLKKEDGHIDWSRPAGEIVNLVRGVNPWPGAFCRIDGKVLKVWRAAAADAVEGGKPGAIVTSGPKTGLVVAAGTEAVSLKEIQAEGKRRMPAGDYLAGHPLPVGTLLD